MAEKGSAWLTFVDSLGPRVHPNPPTRHWRWLSLRRYFGFLFLEFFQLCAVNLVEVGLTYGWKVVGLLLIPLWTLSKGGWHVGTKIKLNFYMSYGRPPGDDERSTRQATMYSVLTL